MDYWLKGGAPKEKLFLGMSLFGRSFTLANPNANGLKAEITGPGERGRFNGDEELLGFNEVSNFASLNWKKFKE